MICCEDASQETVRGFVPQLNRSLPMYQRITTLEFTSQPLPRNAAGKLERK
mgnify:CR=1 FL=1